MKDDVISPHGKPLLGIRFGTSARDGKPGKLPGVSDFKAMIDEVSKSKEPVSPEIRTQLRLMAEYAALDIGLGGGKIGPQVDEIGGALERVETALRHARAVHNNLGN
jgi:hypothetical protein